MEGGAVAVVNHDHLTPVPVDHYATPAIVPLTFEEQTTRTGRDGEVVAVGHAPDGTPQAPRSPRFRGGCRSDEYSAVASADGST